MQNNNEEIYICTTKYGIYISRTIQYLLLLNNIPSKIVFNIDIKKNNLYIILFSHLVNVYPKNYVIYQLEQKNISKWINNKYLLSILYSNIAFDYSESNINKFNNITIKNKINLFRIPLISYYCFKPDIFNKYIDNNLNNSNINKYDILFYGSFNERRYKIINYIKNKLNNKYKFHYVTKLYGDELFEKILQSKIVLNIHYYENAILETCRINEILSCNRLVISELPDESDKNNKEYYDDLIVYYQDLDDLINKINYYLENNEEYNKKILNSKLFMKNNLEFYKKEIKKFIL